MGTFFAEVQIASLAHPERRQTVKLLVDSGSLYTWVSAAVLRDLGVRATERRRLLTIEGRAVDRAAEIMRLAVVLHAGDERARRPGDRLLRRGSEEGRRDARRPSTAELPRWDSLNFPQELGEAIHALGHAFLHPRRELAVAILNRLEDGSAHHRGLATSLVERRRFERHMARRTQEFTADLVAFAAQLAGRSPSARPGTPLQ